jgi:hypothetical protein
MSETLVAEVKAEVAAAAAEVKTVAEAVVGTTKAAEAEVKAVEEKVVEKVEAAFVTITSDEKLFLREAELEYLKATMEIQRLQTIVQAKSKDYQAYIDGLVKKYAIDKAKYMFDGTVALFKKL